MAGREENAFARRSRGLGRALRLPHPPPTTLARALMFVPAPTQVPMLAVGVRDGPLPTLS